MSRIDAYDSTFLSSIYNLVVWSSSFSVFSHVLSMHAFVIDLHILLIYILPSNSTAYLISIRGSISSSYIIYTHTLLMGEERRVVGIYVEIPCIFIYANHALN